MYGFTHEKWSKSPKNCIIFERKQYSGKFLFNRNMHWVSKGVYYCIKGRKV